MRIIVVTDSPQVVKAFSALDRSRDHTVTTFDSGSYAQAQREFLDAEDAFLYFDVDGIADSTITRRIRTMAERRPYRFGLIDPKGAVSDVSQLFHLNAGDFVGKALLKGPLSAKRFRRVLAYAPEQLEESEEMIPPNARDWKPSGSSWDSVDAGEEYTFLMVYAGLDRASDLRKKASEASMRSLRQIFQSILERHFSPYGGRLWMWKEDDGLLLLPFDGKSVDGVLAALRLALNRVVIQCEEFSAFESISWRTALHIGDTIFRKSGSTGGIVSEDVNFVFHLGGRYLDPGDVAMTGACHGLLPSTARHYFEHRGKFESVEVFTLRPLS